MKRTELRNKFLKHETDESRQDLLSNVIIVSLLKKSKRKYYINLNVEDITDNKQFWKTVKPLFSDKTKSAVSITLKGNNKIVESQNEVPNIFNDYFSKIVSLLQIPESNIIDLQFERMSCPTLKSIMKFRRHPSITAIQDAHKGSTFSFSTVEKVDVIREIKNLSKKKAIQDDDIPVKILKENVNFFAECICIFYNYAITTSNFPSFLKIANVTPILKKGSKSKKENFRSVSILPVLSKIFEKLIGKQLSTFFENILSKFQCGFRKGYSTEHCPLLTQPAITCSKLTIATLEQGVKYVQS